MSEPIKIIVTAETEAAAAALRTFLQSTGAGLKALAPAAEHGGEALQKLRETSLLAREGMHGLELGAMTLAGTKLPELAEAVMGVRLALNGTRTVALLFGVTLSEVLLPLGLIAAGIGAGALIWNSYSDGEKKAAEEAENLAKELEKIPGLINQINTLQKAGLMGPGTAAELAGIANGSIPLYKNSAGEFVRNATERLEVMDSTYGMSPGTGGSHMIDSENTPATTAERNAYVAKLASLNAQQEAVAKLSELEKQASTDRLTGLQKEIAKINEELAKKNEAIETELKIAGLAVSGKQYAAAQQAMADNVAVAQQAIHAAEVKKAEADATAEKKAQAELDKLAVGVQKDIEAFMKRNVETEKLISEEKRRQTAEAQKQAQLQQEISRANIEAKLIAVQGNPFLTNAEKNSQSIPLYQQLALENAQRIAALQTMHDQTSDATAQLEMEKQITELKRQQAELGNKIIEASKPTSFAMSFGAMFAQMSNEAQITYQKLASVFSGVMNTAINSISHGITGLIEGTMTWGQALRSIYNDIMNEIISAIVSMGVRWMIVTLTNAAFGHSVQASLLVASLATSKALIAANTAPAALAAVATYGGALSAAIPVTAIAAAGMAAFADGGRPNPGEVALIGERGPELWIPDAAGTIIPNHKLDSYMSRGGSAAVSGSAAGGDSKGVSVYAFTDPRQMADHLQKNDSHEKWVVDVMSRNMHKFR